MIETLQQTLTGGGRRLPLLAAANGLAALFEAVTIALLIPFLTAVGSGAPNVEIPLATSFSVGATVSTRDVTGILLVALAGRALFQYLAASYWARSVYYYERLHRRRLVEAFTAASWSCQSREPAGKLQQLLTGNVEQIAKAFTATTYSLSHAVSLVILVVCAVSVSVRHTIAALAVLAVLFLIVRPVTLLARSAAARRADALASYANLVSQSLGLMKEVRVFGIDGWLTAETERHSREIGVTRRRQNVCGALVPIIYQNGSGLMLVGGVAAAFAWGWPNGATSPAVSMLLLIRAASHGQHLHLMYHQLQETIPYLRQLSEATRDYRRERSNVDGEAIATIDEIEYRGVEFGYTPDRPVLYDVTFRAARGDVIAIVGPSGVGKSTLLQLLLRLREPTRGSILVNGRPIEGVSLSAWFPLVGYVPQDLGLYDETIAECIRFHRPDVSPEQIRRAAEQAGILDEILRMPDGFETRVGERGGNLSVGQRQRVCIARALVGSPDLFVFDEPTSALDSESERTVLRTLAALRGETIVFVAAHRSSTLTVCTKALVLQDDRPAMLVDVDGGSATESYLRELVGASES